jgi:hypothetical protein
VAAGPSGSVIPPLSGAIEQTGPHEEIAKRRSLPGLLAALLNFAFSLVTVLVGVFVPVRYLLSFEWLLVVSPPM